MVNEVDPRTAHAAVAAGARLIDVREPVEHAEARIPGAVLIPLAEVPARLADIPGGEDVYIYCRTGLRSGRAVEWLALNGRPRAINVAGGIIRWATEGLPVE